jgi:hypothetical protein
VIRFFRRRPGAAPEPVDPESDPVLDAILRQMTPADQSDDWLEAFLVIDELDDLFTRHGAADLSTGQESRVRAVLRDRAPRQARFNLLMRPGVIPGDARLDALDAGLVDEDPYMRIAAAVGLQDLAVADADWPPVRDALIGLVADPIGAIANRATVTLAGNARSGDGPAILDAARQADDRHLQNLLIALVRAGADREVLELLPLVLVQEGLAASTRAWLERWAADGRRPDGDPPAYFMAPALGYIPNLDG